MRDIDRNTRKELLNLLLKTVSSNCKFRCSVNNEFSYEYIPFYGKLSLQDFLKRLYPSYVLEKENVSSGLTYIHKPIEEILNDEELKLNEGNEDEPLLDFLCEIFNPEVRDDTKKWRALLEQINSILRRAGYEIYECQEDNNMNTTEKYKGRKITPVTKIEEKKDLFSERYKKYLDENGDFEEFLPQDYRNDLGDIMNNFNSKSTEDQDLGGGYIRTTRADLLYFVTEELDGFLGFDLSKTYRRKSQFERVEYNRIFDYPLKYLFDFIELQYERLDSDKRKEYKEKINTLLEGINFPFILNKYGLFEIKNYYVWTDDKYNKLSKGVKETKVGQLLEESLDFYKSSDEKCHRKAIQTLWDAFKIVKKLYNASPISFIDTPSENINKDNVYLENTLNEEVTLLTTIGERFYISGHDKPDFDLPDITIYDYFFNRCYSFLILALTHMSAELVQYLN